MKLRRGVGALHALLDQEQDLRRLDIEGFRAWLGAFLDRWQSDPVFVQQLRIRDLRKQNPEIGRLEEALRQAAEAEAATAGHARLEQLSKAQDNAEKAIAGLSSALVDAPPEDRERLMGKRAAFLAARAARAEALSALVHQSPERQALLRIDAELARLRARIGLDREELTLAALQKQKGRRSGRAGVDFEALAAEICRERLLPALVRRLEGGELLVLRGMRLGAARLELDVVLVHRPADGGIADVLAIVEAKRNVNDLGHGFRQRQADLGWLVGDRSAYDPEQTRTHAFPSGHFDRAVAHPHPEGEVLLGPGSFRRFRRDPETGFFLRRLYLLSRSGPLWGISGAALGRLRHRVATDPRWDPEDPRYLRRLLRWSQGLAEEIEAPEVLRLYAARPTRARQVLLLN